MKIIAFSIAGLFLFVSSAVAIIVDTSATDVIQRNPDGSIRVETNQDGVQDTINIKQGTIDTKTNVGGQQIDTMINRSGSQINIDQTIDGQNVSTTTILRDTAGRTINISAGLGSQEVTLDVNSKSVVVNLEGSSVSFIKSDNDLSVYNRLVIEERPSVNSVQVSDGEVRVSYNEPSRFLWIVPADLNGEVVVDSNGNVEVQLPWYGFLFKKKHARNIRLNVEAMLSSPNSGVQLNLLSGNSNAIARVQNGARVVNVITGTVQGEVGKD